MKTTAFQRGAFIVALITVVIAIDQWGVRWWQAPWSYAALGPTLTGTWEGALQAGQGTEYRLYLELEYRHHGRRLRRGESNLTGRGLLCSRAGGVSDYDVNGDASRSGESIWLSLDAPDRAQSGRDMTLRGSWDGSTLTLRPSFNPFRPDGTFVPNPPVTPNAPDDGFAPAALQKHDRASFLAACGRLTR